MAFLITGSNRSSNTRKTRTTTACLLLLTAFLLSGGGVEAKGAGGSLVGGGSLRGSSKFKTGKSPEADHAELDQVLREALGSGHGLSQAQLEAKVAQVEPIFRSMPKNMHGRVGRDAMQYMVARYFGHQHGWYIRGFDPSSLFGNASAGADGAAALRSKFPVYVEQKMEQMLEHVGFGLHDMVTIVVVLERMIFDERLEMLEDAYHLRQTETDALLSRRELMEVVYTYMTLYAYEADRKNRTDLGLTFGKIQRSYPKGWPSGMYGLSETKAVLEEAKAANPFAAPSHPGYSFEVAARATARVSEGYGQWTNEQQCAALKGALTDLDRDGDGRVRLADFYERRAVNNNWFLEETREYLRETGVLDETSAAKGPQVIIPNYVQAPTNCLEVSSFYTICCLKECDGLLGAIEREVQAPLASPARILPVVQRLIDAREEEPRNLTARMAGMLEGVAEQSGNRGQVPLHGRLFAQWLHYAFPYQCPYPQLKAEAANWQTISEYERRTGLPNGMTAEQMDRYIEESRRADETEEQKQQLLEEEQGHGAAAMSQWTMDEELYVGHHHQGPRAGVGGGAWSSGLGGLARAGVVLGGFLAIRPLVGKALQQLFLGADDFGKKNVFV